MLTRNSIARPGGWVALLLAAAGTWASPSWAQSGSKTYFVGQDGIPVLTNRPNAYRHREGYIEKKLELTPVIITGKYRTKPTEEFTAADFREVVSHWSKRYGLDPNMVLAVIKAESNFDPRAESKRGARGLMQLMPGTAMDMSVTDIYDPEQNIAGGTQYLAKLLEMFDNRTDLALAAYNAGPSTVQEHGGVPPFNETREYISRVQDFARQFAQGREDVRVTPGKRRIEYAQEPSAAYTVYFKNGNTQPADTVKEQELFYALEYSGRKYLVRKVNVQKIAKAGKPTASAE